MKSKINCAIIIWDFVFCFVKQTKSKEESYYKMVKDGGRVYEL